MNGKPRCGRVQRFLPVELLAKKLAKLDARIEGTGVWELVTRFKSLEELKEKRRRITTVLRRYEGLVEERPDLQGTLNQTGSESRSTLTRIQHSSGWHSSYILKGPSELVNV